MKVGGGGGGGGEGLILRLCRLISIAIDNSTFQSACMIFAGMGSTSLSERDISLVIMVCYRWGQWRHICAVRRLGRSLAPHSL